VVEACRSEIVALMLVSREHHIRCIDAGAEVAHTALSPPHSEQKDAKVSKTGLSCSKRLKAYSLKF